MPTLRRRTARVLGSLALMAALGIAGPIAYGADPAPRAKPTSIPEPSGPKADEALVEALLESAPEAKAESSPEATGVASEAAPTERAVEAMVPKAAHSIDQAAMINNGFGVRLTEALASANGASNLFVSPTSVSTALLMVAGGAGGETKAAFESTLGVSPDGLSDAAKAFGALNGALTGAEGVEFLSANGAWVADSLALQAAFAEGLREEFAARIESVDFTDPSVVEEINAWVAEQTKGKIDSVVAPPMDDNLMVLANALYFRGDWASKFDSEDTESQPFTKLDGSAVDASMMTQSGEFLYHEGEGGQAVILPYAGEAFEMLLVLPPEGTDPASVIGVDAAWMDRSAFSSRSGTVGLPKLTLDYTAELKEVLTALGLAPAFGEADFSRMFAAGVQATISSVIHKTALEVDEEGTTAAAVTAVIVARSFDPNQAKPFEMVLDRPFLLAIRHADSGALVFVGLVHEPAV